MTEFTANISLGLSSSVITLSKKFRTIAILKIWVDPSVPGLREMYKEHVQKHNSHTLSHSYPNSGMDVFVAHKTILLPNIHSDKLKLAIKAEMYTCYSQDHHLESGAYYLLPRSSLSNTPLLQSNHVGLIDMGYRGEIMAPIRNLSNDEYVIEPFTRLFQLTHPLACPILVDLVDNEEDLSSSERGSGGFGSTGIMGSFV
jgi:dUTP pyrophosphatase